MLCFSFFFNDTATTEIYTLSLHDALPTSYAPSTSPECSTYAPPASSVLAHSASAYAGRPATARSQRADALHFSWSVPAPWRCSGEWTWARESCASSPATGRPATRSAHESPKRLQLGHWLGYSGSSPSNVPPSTVTGPAVTAATATARSRICA